MISILRSLEILLQHYTLQLENEGQKNYKVVCKDCQKFSGFRFIHNLYMCL